MPLITRAELARLLSCSQRSIINLERQGLPRIAIGGMVRYDFAAVRAWLDTKQPHGGPNGAPEA